jgi:hypothetical protein
VPIPMLEAFADLGSRRQMQATQLQLVLHELLKNAYASDRMVIRASRLS